MQLHDKQGRLILSLLPNPQNDRLVFRLHTRSARAGVCMRFEQALFAAEVLEAGDRQYVVQDEYDMVTIMKSTIVAGHIVVKLDSEQVDKLIHALRRQAYGLDV